MTPDELFMKAALKEAQKASEEGEVPIGCVIVKDGKIIARGRNAREKKKNAILHAEMIAIDKACKKLGGWRLWQCDLYVTLEPCPMCAGAIVNARIPRVVYGAKDANGGAFDSVLNLRSYPLCSKPTVIGGVLENECSALLTAFFEKKRKKLKK